MLFLITPLLVAFLVSVLTIKILLPLAPHIGLVDLPSDRKKHDGAIPLIGGISIFTGVLLASSIFIDRSQLLNLYLISSALLVFVGTLDDIYDLSVISRIIFQALVASIMVFGADVYISNFGNILGLGNIDIGHFGMIFTILACLVSINAYNMVDGIDGLAGSMSIITLTSVVVLNMIAQQTEFTILPLVVVVATVPFLFYNVSRRNPRGKKIFMGDAGSMFMGLTVIWLLSLGSQGETKSFSPVTSLWIMAIPLMDMFAIMFKRAKAGVSPFRADNGHLHHLLLKAGFTSRQTLLIITMISILLSFFGILGQYFAVPEWLMLNCFIVLFLVYLVLLNYAFKWPKPFASQ
jgi:UDP-GlcNAc:undecaprenyl-phosphate GlcNAc-1-phosphate transferase